MTMLTTSGNGGLLTPEEINTLIVQPVAKASVVYQVSTVVVIGAHEYGFPILSETPSAARVLEGEEIPIDDAWLTS
jgi:HK97 family phage major capsid protein